MKMHCNGKCIGRVLIGAVLFIFGAMKVMSLSGTSAYIASVGLPMPTVLAVVAAAIEILGGLALITNRYMKHAAHGLAVYLVIITIIFHRNIADQTQLMLALKNIAIIGGVISFCGCGNCCKGGEEKCEGGKCDSHGDSHTHASESGCCGNGGSCGCK